MTDACYRCGWAHGLTWDAWAHRFVCQRCLRGLPPDGSLEPVGAGLKPARPEEAA